MNKRFKINKINLKVDNDFQLIIVTTFFICSILIISTIIFFKIDGIKFNPFNLNNSVIEKSKQIQFPIDGKVKLYRRDKGEVEQLDLEEYIVGVVASEMPANFEKEALKAQAVAARTFYINKRNNTSDELKRKGAEISDSTDCQVYMSKEERIKSWNKKQAEDNWNKIQKAVEETKGQVITYEGEILEYPQFFAISSGKTEDAKDVFATNVPYLKSTESKGEEIAPKYRTTVDISISDFINKINEKYPKVKASKNNIKSLIKIKDYTESGSIKEIQIGDQNVKGSEFRKIFSLNSTNFTWNFTQKNVSITCTGYGHGVGMSQWGANVMAKDGSTYEEIIKHYYSGVNIEKINYKK